MRLSSLDFKDTIIFSFFKKKLHLFFVPRVGFEPTTHRLEICCSIQLSYRGIYVFLIKYNKKIKNCFFQRTLVSLTISKILFFFEISNFFSTFSSVIVNITKPNQFFNELLRFFVFLTFAKILFFFETSKFFLNFFYFFPVTYCFYGTSVYVTFVTFRTNIWRKLMNNVFLTVQFVCFLPNLFTKIYLNFLPTHGLEP